MKASQLLSGLRALMQDHGDREVHLLQTDGSLPLFEVALASPSEGASAKCYLLKIADEKAVTDDKAPWVDPTAGQSLMVSRDRRPPTAKTAKAAKKVSTRPRRTTDSKR